MVSSGVSPKNSKASAARIEVDGVDAIARKKAKTDAAKPAETETAAAKPAETEIEGDAQSSEVQGVSVEVEPAEEMQPDAKKLKADDSWIKLDTLCPTGRHSSRQPQLFPPF